MGALARRLLAGLAAGLIGWAGAASAGPPAPPAPAPPPLVLQADVESVELSPWLTRWVDTGGQARWEHAQQRLAQAAFQPFPKLGSAGYTQAAHWYTATLSRTPQAGARWVLAIGAPYLDDVQVWLQRADGAVIHQPMGDRHLADGRPLPGRLHAMALAVPEAGAGTAVRLWIRVSSASALNVSAELWRPDAFLAQETQTVGAWGAVLGLLALAALTHLLFGLWLRDAIMLAFAAFIGTLLMLHLGTSGMALLLVARPPSWYSDLIVGCGSFGSAAVASIGTMLVLDVRRLWPRLRWLYLGSAFLLLALLPLAVTDLYGRAAGAVNLWGLGMSLFNTGVAVRGWLRVRSRLYGLFALATISIGAGAVATVAALLGLVPVTPLTRMAYQGATVVYLLVMLVAMAMRMASLRHDKLMAQDRVLEERRFAAIVAHEFRNPLASIDRSANLLQLIPDMPPAQAALRLSGMRHQVARLTTLLDSFLQAQGDERRPLRLSAGPVAMDTWLNRLRQEFDDDTRTRLTVHAEPSTLRAHLDPDLAALALRNLVDNALRYSAEDQPVEITARLAGSGPALELEVADRGPGLSDEDLQQLGQPYYRGEPAIGRQGTGLGYYFSQRIAHIHGGQLTAARRQPQGLVVTLHLPQPG